MNIQSFLTAYELIVKGEADTVLVDKIFNDLFERIEGSYLEEDFVKANDKITKLMAIDKAAHFMHSKDPDLLSFAFPEADARFVKDTLDRLSGLEAIAPVRKASRGYFTTFASTEGLEFLQKQVGALKSNKATREEIKEDIAEYERLFKAGISSHAELLVLSRYYGDKGQRFLDEVKKKAFTADDPMVVGGYASVEVVDKEGHLITTEALTKAFYKFMDSFRTRNVNFAHSDVQAGWPLRVWINQNGDIYKSGVDDKGLYLVSEVRPDITIANKVEKEIEAGVIRSYSIAGSALDKSVETKGNRVIMVVNELELAEISFCEKPVNQESNFDIIKSYPSGKVLGGLITKEDVVSSLPNKELPLSDYTVCMVGGLIRNGQTENDIDIIIRAEKDSFIGRAIQLSLSRELPVALRDRVRFIFEAEGPHGDYIPLYNLRLGPVARQEVSLEAISKAEKQLVGMTDEELRKVGEEAGANFETNIPFDEFKMGMQIEQEHYDLTGMDPLKTAKIALAHIRESATYYTDLKNHVEKAKDKVVYRENETDLTRSEDSNDIAIKKEASRLMDKSGSNEQVKQSPNVQTPVTKVGEIHCAIDKFNQFLGKDQPPAMAPARPGLRWDAISHRWVKPKSSVKTKNEKDVLKLINTEKEPEVIKSSTTHITSAKPIDRKPVKVTWGSKSVSEDDMANLAAFLDFVKDQKNDR
jgi:HK97 family phage prohead protease